MAFSRQLGVLGILGACWFVAVGCSDDEDRVSSTEDGGEGGEGSGTGGKSSSGGNQSTSGSAGKGGAAGSSNAGTNTGGMGESGSGAGGEAGGGMVAGAGGEAGASGGAASGGAGGEGGEGGAPEPVAAMCKYQCDGPEDCTFVDGPPHQCDLTTGSCVECLANADCTVTLSLWFTPCTDDSACFDGFQVCVEWQGDGWCAELPDENSPEFPCAFGGYPQTLPRFGSQGDVEVCAADALCLAGSCQVGCRDGFAAPCADGTGDTCSPTTGFCECAQGTECDSGVCGPDSRCVECVTSEHCSPSPADKGLDTCVAGKCGCSSTDACDDRPYTNAPKLCE